jgi:hypothetical protein
MTYDAARGEVVLFGGCCDNGYFNDTWTWGGANWTQRHPATSPSIRVDAGMTYDAARAEPILFGGGGGVGQPYLGDTWTWDGNRWRIPLAAHSKLNPESGPPRTTTRVIGTGFAGYEEVMVIFVDSVKGKSVLGTFATHGSGTLKTEVTIPADATAGPQKITAVGTVSHQKARAIFTVT